MKKSHSVKRSMSIVIPAVITQLKAVLIFVKKLQIKTASKHNEVFSMYSFKLNLRIN